MMAPFSNFFSEKGEKGFLFEIFLYLCTLKK